MGNVWASLMAGFDLSDYFETVDESDPVASLSALKALYKDADDALAKLAKGLGDGVDSLPDMETKLLDHQAFLIALASKTRCRTEHEICAKVDFLKTVHLDAMHTKNFSETDQLILSIWQDLKGR